MSIDLQIRRAGMRDRDALHAMQEASMRTLGSAYYDPELIEGFIARIDTMDDSLIEDGTYFVVESEG
jgi:hypothetical protein